MKSRFNCNYTLIRKIVVIVVFVLFEPYSLANEVDSSTLSAQQVLTLGIESKLVSEFSKIYQYNWFPGKISVPIKNQQLISSEFSGVISRVYVVNGEKIKRGQIIAEIKSSQYIEKQRELQQAIIQKELLQLNYQRDQQLFREGIIAESRLHNSKSQLQQSQSLISQYQRSFNLANIASSDKNTILIKSPSDAVVLDINVQLGQRIDPNSLIAKIANFQQLAVEFQLPLNLASKLVIGTKVQLKQIDSLAKITAKNLQIDSSSQNVMFIAELENNQGNLLPGQLVEIGVNIQSDNKASLIPVESISEINGVKIAFVMSKQNNQQYIVTKRKIEVIEPHGQASLVRGIKSEEYIIHKGIASLKLLFEKK